MCPEPSLWTWSQALWTQSEPDPSGNFSDQIILFSAKPEPATTGPKATTLRELSSSTPCWMSSEKKPKAATASKDSKSPTPWEVVPDPEWEPF